jgi:ribosomal protein S4
MVTKEERMKVFRSRLSVITGNKKFLLFNKKRRKNKKFKKQFAIKKHYVKLFFNKKSGNKIKKYYSRSKPFVYYTRKKKVHRRSFFHEETRRWDRISRTYLKKKNLIRVWFWRKKKIKKQWRLWHNFFFFFKQHWSDNSFKYRVRKKWLGKGKKKLKTLVTRYQPKKKLILRFKDVYKKKLYFKKFLVRYYGFKRIRQLKNLYNVVAKKPGNKIINIFMYLESQLSSICLRMNFFWNLHKSRLWISGGVVYVNGRLILYSNYLIKLNDLLTVFQRYPNKYRLVFSFISFKKNYPKKCSLLNYSEYNKKSRSGILFFLPYRVEDLRLTLKKKKKHWIKTKIFAFLVNSFH